MEISKDLLFRITPPPLLWSAAHLHPHHVRRGDPPECSVSLARCAWPCARHRWFAYAVLFLHFLSLCLEVARPLVHSHSVDLRPYCTRKFCVWTFPPFVVPAFSANGVIMFTNQRKQMQRVGCLFVASYQRSPFVMWLV